MPKDFQINGEALIVVKFGAHILAMDPDQIDEDPDELSGSTEVASPNKALELGLTDPNGRVRITPNFRHFDVQCDDFGPDIPAELLWMLADVNIRFTLTHYDWDVLDVYLSESMGGTVLGDNTGAGIMSPAGTPMRGNSQYLASGYYFVSLNILSPVLQQPWHFPATYMTGPPVEYPLGTERSLVQCNIRAIPFASGFQFSPGSPEIFSSGAILWDRISDS